MHRPLAPVVGVGDTRSFYAQVAHTYAYRIHNSQTTHPIATNSMTTRSIKPWQLTPWHLATRIAHPMDSSAMDISPHEQLAQWKTPHPWAAFPIDSSLIDKSPQRQLAPWTTHPKVCCLLSFWDEVHLPFTDVHKGCQQNNICVTMEQNELMKCIHKVMSYLFFVPVQFFV